MFKLVLSSLIKNKYGLLYDFFILNINKNLKLKETTNNIVIHFEFTLIKSSSRIQTV